MLAVLLGALGAIRIRATPTSLPSLLPSIESLELHGKVNEEHRTGSMMVRAEDALGRPVGSCSVAAARIGDDGYISPVAPVRPWLSGLYVRPDQRRRGVARTLIGASEQASLRCGFNELVLNVHEHNEPALRLYESLGYEVEEQCPPRWHDWSLFWPDGPHLPRMGRHLSMRKCLRTKIDE